MVAEPNLIADVVANSRSRSHKLCIARYSRRRFSSPARARSPGILVVLAPRVALLSIEVR